MKKKYVMRWLMQAIGGLLLTGAGLCMAIDAGAVKSQGGEWFGYGTLSLVVFQSGLCLMVDSLRFHILAGNASGRE